MSNRVPSLRFLGKQLSQRPRAAVDRRKGLSAAQKSVLGLAELHRRCRWVMMVVGIRIVGV
jgi:hypothetical protein